MSQLRQQEAEFESKNISVVVVSFDSSKMAQGFAQSTKLKWPLLLDSDRKLYRHYGFRRADWWTLLKPDVMWKYIINIMTGDLPGRPGKDIKQLGGNVLIDPDGTVALNHVSADPHDNPTSDQIFKIVSN